DLYNGTAGVGLFLAGLAAATGVAQYGDAVRGAARWLTNPPWDRGRAAPGLHCGEAGVGLLFVRLASLLDEPGCLTAAELRARRPPIPRLRPRRGRDRPGPGPARPGDG